MIGPRRAVEYRTVVLELIRRNRVIMGDQRDATLVDETQFACNRAAPKQTPPPPPGLDASACRWCVRTHPTRKHAHKHRVGSYIAASDPRSASFSRYSTYLVLTGVKHEHRACARTPPRAHTDGTIGVGESRCVCVCVCVCVHARARMCVRDRPTGRLLIGVWKKISKLQLAVRKFGQDRVAAVVGRARAVTGKIFSFHSRFSRVCARKTKLADARAR